MRNPYYSGPISDHFDGTRFFHPDNPGTDKTFADMLRWKLREHATPWPKHIPSRTGIVPQPQTETLTVTHIGHASVQLQLAGHNLLLDPVWSRRASPLRWIGPRRRTPPAVALADLPPIHAILLTHNHYDHLDTRTLAQLIARHNPRILTPLGNDTLIRKAAPHAHVTVGDWWTSHDLLPGLRATIVPAYHWSSRSTRDYRMALWGGFILEAPETTVYCAGDTGYAEGKLFREIAERFPSIDLALVPIGAYAPRWFMRTQHADPDEALQIVRSLRTKAALGLHWGTFSLTDEPWEEPALRFTESARKQGLSMANFHPLRPGDVWSATSLTSPGEDSTLHP